MTSRFAELLFDYRRRRKLLQKQVALEAGIAPSYLAGLENGRRTPPEKKTLAALINALALTPPEARRLAAEAASERAAHFLQNSHEALPGLDCLVQLARALPSLNPREIATLESMIDTLAHRGQGGAPM